MVHRLASLQHRIVAVTLVVTATAISLPAHATVAPPVRLPDWADDFPAPAPTPPACPVPTQAQCMSDSLNAFDPNKDFWKSDCGPPCIVWSTR